MEVFPIDKDIKEVFCSHLKTTGTNSLRTEKQNDNFR